MFYFTCDRCSTYRVVGAGHVLRQDAVIDGGQCVGAREAECEHTEVPLQSRVDGEAAGRRVHTGHVLRVVDVLQGQLGPVVPVTVVQVLAH